MATAVNGSTGHPAGARIVSRLTERGADATRRYRAVSMQLAAYLDDHYVELHVLTGDGESIALACPGDSIFALQRHIEQLTQQCSEIAGWSRSVALPATGDDRNRVSAQQVVPVCTTSTSSERLP